MIARGWLVSLLPLSVPVLANCVRTTMSCPLSTVSPEACLVAQSDVPQSAKLPVWVRTCGSVGCAVHAARLPLADVPSLSSGIVSGAHDTSALSLPLVHSALMSKYRLTLCVAPSLLCAVATMSDSGMLSRFRSVASTGDRKLTVRVTPSALKVNTDWVDVVLSDVWVIAGSAGDPAGSTGSPRNRCGVPSIYAIPVIALTVPSQCCGQVPGRMPVLLFNQTLR